MNCSNWTLSAPENLFTVSPSFDKTNVGTADILNSVAESWNNNPKGNVFCAWKNIEMFVKRILRIKSINQTHFWSYLIVININLTKCNSGICFRQRCINRCNHLARWTPCCSKVQNRLGIVYTELCDGVGGIEDFYRRRHPSLSIIIHNYAERRWQSTLKL